MVLLKFPTILSLNPWVTEKYYVYPNSVFTCIEINMGSFSTVELEIDGVKTEEAHFRGRKLQGATISLPSGYSGTFSPFFLTLEKVETFEFFLWMYLRNDV